MTLSNDILDRFIGCCAEIYNNAENIAIRGPVTKIAISAKHKVIKITFAYLEKNDGSASDLSDTWTKLRIKTYTSKVIREEDIVQLTGMIILHSIPSKEFIIFHPLEKK